MTPIPPLFPASPLVGNDDSGFGDEDNNPYTAFSDPILGHAVGEVTSNDPPNAALADAGGLEGYSFEEDDLFQEFARLEINGDWFVISDPVPWKLIMKIQFTNGSWIDNGTITGPGN